MAVLCVFLTAACGYDYRDNKIPNYLIVLIALWGMAWRWKGGWIPGIFSYLGEAVLIILLLYPFFKIGTIGAGDVKLLGVTAGYLPFKKILVFLFVSLLVAAVISLVKMWKNNNFSERLWILFRYFADVLREGKWYRYPDMGKKIQAAGICMSGPVLLSILLYLGGVY